MNKCHNCKFLEYQMYGSNTCKSTFRLDTSNGIYVKIFPLTSEIREKNDHCKNYKPNLIMKIKMVVGAIQGWWYFRKYPEKMI